MPWAPWLPAAQSLGIAVTGSFNAGRALPARAKECTGPAESLGLGNTIMNFLLPCPKDGKEGILKAKDTRLTWRPRKHCVWFKVHRDLQAGEMR